MKNQQRAKATNLRTVVKRLGKQFRKRGRAFHLNQFRRMQDRSLHELFATLRDADSGTMSYEKAVIAAAIAVKGKGSKLIMQQLTRAIAREESPVGGRMQKLVDAILAEVEKLE